jgi:hypothetical protein
MEEPEPEAVEGFPHDDEAEAEQLLRHAQTMWEGAEDEWWWYDGTEQEQAVPYSADFCRKLSRELQGTTIHDVERARQEGIRVPTPCGQREVGRGPSSWVQFAKADPSRRRRRVETNKRQSPTLADAAAWVAAVAGDSGRLESALSAGARVDFRGPVYACDTLLHAAVRNGRMSCVRVLCEHGADVHARNVYCETPMDLLRAAGSGGDPGGCMSVLQGLSRGDGHSEATQHAAASSAENLIGWKVRLTSRQFGGVTGIVFSRHEQVRQEGVIYSRKKELLGCREGCHMVALLGLERQGVNQGGFFGVVRSADAEASWSDDLRRCVVQHEQVNLSVEPFEACRPATAAELDLAKREVKWGAGELDHWQRHQCPPGPIQSELSIETELHDRVREILESGASTALGLQSERQSERLLVAAGLAALALGSGDPDHKLRQRIAAVRAQAAELRCHEQMRRDACEATLLAAQKRAARDALQRGKKAMESAKAAGSEDQRFSLFKDAERNFKQGLESGKTSADVSEPLNELPNWQWDLRHWLVLSQIQIHICCHDFASAARILDQKPKFDLLGHTLDVTGGEGLQEAWIEAQKAMKALMLNLFQEKAENARTQQQRTEADVSMWQKALENVAQSANILTDSDAKELPCEDAKVRTHSAMFLAEKAYGTSARLMSTIKRQPALHHSISRFRSAIRLCRYAEKIRRTPREGPESHAAFDSCYTAGHSVYHGYRAGAVLWAYTMARTALKRSSIETDPLMKDTYEDKMLELQASVDKLHAWLDERIKLARGELKRRNQIRTNIDSGERLIHRALGNRAVTAALRNFKDAANAIGDNPNAHFRDSERAELEALIQAAEKELADQKAVQEHQTGMVRLLERSPTTLEKMADSTAARAAKYCEKALQLEPAEDGNQTGEERDQYGYHCQPERFALLQMQQICLSWDAADRLMVIGSNLDGAKALVHYSTAMKAATDAASCRPTEAYEGGALVLGVDAMKILRASIASAEKEIKRRDRFCKAIDTGKAHLRGKRANASLVSFQDADTEAIHEDEWAQARDCHSEGEHELQLQSKIKATFFEAVEVLGNPGDQKATIALQKVESALAVDPTGQQDTNEYRALECMKVMCDEWIQGADSLAKAYAQNPEECKKAKEHFDASKAARTRAEQIPMTNGYHGDRIQLSAQAAAALDDCIKESQDKIDDFERGLDVSREVSNMHTNMSAAQRALKKKLESTKLSERERADFMAELQKVQAEEERQKQVKTHHQHGIRALCDNDPVKARGCYEEALGMETSGFSRESVYGVDTAQPTKRNERAALEHMHALCESWIEGNATSVTACNKDIHPNKWDGELAKKNFEQCQALSQQCDDLEPTDGYWGHPIRLDSAKTELKLCLKRAHAEIQRRQRFEKHIKGARPFLSQPVFSRSQFWLGFAISYLLLSRL